MSKPNAADEALEELQRQLAAERAELALVRAERARLTRAIAQLRAEAETRGPKASPSQNRLDRAFANRQHRADGGAAEQGQDPFARVDPKPS
jgi:cell division protein FtsB